MYVKEILGSLNVFALLVVYRILQLNNSISKCRGFVIIKVGFINYYEYTSATYSNQRHLPWCPWTTALGG